MVPSRQALSTLFASLSRDSCRWSLTRTLRSDNPLDIQGELRGTATFTPLCQNPASAECDMVYREEGDMPNTLGAGMNMPGLRWSKTYLWRLSDDGKISVWFVKVTRGGDHSKNSANLENGEEPDYLFHEFDFDDGGLSPPIGKDEILVSAPQPPPSPATDTAAVLLARGNHLCINDMYRTAYAFHIHPESGEVLSWSSRHVVKGPKKNQDIVNMYRLERP